jgi:hypothetical protein
MTEENPEKTIIVVHANSRGDFACMRKGFYGRILNLTPREGKPRRLQAGSFMHRMLECYYQLKMWSDFPHDMIVEEAIRYGRYSLVAEQFNNLPQEEAEFIIRRFVEYCEFYQHDTWKPVMVEQPFAKTIYEDESYHIIGESQIDWAGSDPAPKGIPGIFVVDHKTEEKHSVPDTLQDQGHMYAWWSEQPYVVSNRIGLQEKKKDPFHREILSYDREKVQEWLEEVAGWAINTHIQIKQNYFPRNFSICHMYGKCIYAQICEGKLEDRERIINRDYISGEDRNHFGPER